MSVSAEGRQGFCLPPAVSRSLLCLLFVLVAVTGCSRADEGGSVSPTTPSSPPTADTPATETSTTTTTSPTTTVVETIPPDTIAPQALTIEAFPVPAGSRPHDVAPAIDGGVWYTAQGSGQLGWLEPSTGQTRHIDLGAGSRPHGVIVGADGSAWVTDGGLNAIVVVDPDTLDPVVFPLPDDRPDANLNTATFDGRGILWFTGQNGIYGSLDPASGEMTVYDAPRGRGPYGIATTPGGSVYLASLAGSYVGAVQPDGSLDILEPPTAGQGARRVWADSSGSIWVSEWNSGNLSRLRPDSDQWDTWALPGDASTYAVYVDDRDIVWTSDFASNAIVRFDRRTEQFTAIPLPHSPGDVRQILGRPGEVWGAESAADHLVLIRTNE
ncbi:MAG: lyase [Acidimicrobiia bacterium]|nr:lyase [Acidimicrobiia bacterium]